MTRPMTSPTRLLLALALASAASTRAHAADKVAALHLPGRVSRVPDAQLAFDPGVGAQAFAALGDAPATILVLDELNARFEDMDSIHRTALQFLQAQPAELAQPTALMAASDSRLLQLSGFTRDRDALVAQIEQRIPEYPAKMTAGQSTQFARMSASLRALDRIAQAASAGRTRKSLVWIGNGYAPVLPGEVSEPQRALVRRAVHDCARALLAGKIALYGLRLERDPAAPVGRNALGGLEPPVADSGRTERGTLQFSDLAAATGGESLVASKRTGAAVARAISTASQFAAQPEAEPSNTVAVAVPPAGVER